MSLTKLDPEHRERILETVDGQVVALAAAHPSQCATIRFDAIGVGLRGATPAPATHMVLDCEGDQIGWGLSEDDAVLDALLRALAGEHERFVELRKRVHGFQSALKGLDT